jgi:hypothetical protein
VFKICGRVNKLIDNRKIAKEYPKIIVDAVK